MRRDDDILVGKLSARLDGNDVACVERVGSADDGSVVVDIGLQANLVESVEKVVLDEQGLGFCRVADVLLHPGDGVIKVHSVNLMGHLNHGRVCYCDVGIGLVTVSPVVDKLCVRDTREENQEGGKE